MGKRTLLAFSLSLLVIIGYNYFLSQKYPPPPPADLPAPKDVGADTPIVSAQAQEKKIAQATAGPEEQQILVETDLMKLVITSSGAMIKSCKLKKYPAEKIDITALKTQLNKIAGLRQNALPSQAEFLQRQQAKLELLLEKIGQNVNTVELVSLPALIDGQFFPQLVVVNDEAASAVLGSASYQCAQEGLVLNEQKPNGELTFTYLDPQGRQIIKRYSFSNSNYLIGLSITFPGGENKNTPSPLLVYLGADIGQSFVPAGVRGYGYTGPVSCFRSVQQSWIQREKYPPKEKDVFVRREHSGMGEILWTGLENKYFLAALIPEMPRAESIVVEKNKFGEQKTALRLPANASGMFNFKLYLGPKQEQQLKEIGATLEKVIDYGFFGLIARFIYQILVFFSRWTHNFGWAIVLLCLLTKLVFYPLTFRSMEAMQKMQQQMQTIQPEIETLRQQFKNNPAKLNKEIMELYRKKGISPLSGCQSGCLPLLLQMPVFFALYAVLYNSIELRGTPFLGWLSDLSAKDPCYILPILMGISMFVQQKLTTPLATSGVQKEQAMMMSIVMPVVLTWVFASLPSGVVLYWLVFNLLSILEQLLRKKRA